MSTLESTKKSPSLTEIEVLLAAEPAATALSCSQLQSNLDNDFDILDNLQDFPAKNRAAVRAAIMKQIQATVAQMKAQHCTIG